MAKPRRPRGNNSRSRLSRQTRGGQSSTRATDTVRKKRSKVATFVGAAIAMILILTVGAFWQLLNGLHDSQARTFQRPSAPLRFVGSAICATCHQAEARLWRSSQHRHAMAQASEKSVLGNFANVQFEYHGVKSRFFKKDGEFYVETDGPDGKLATFRIKYAFGVYPLQQYLIEFPDGRIQALSIVWDSRPKEQGGQRWFHLYPNDNIRFNDVLHWTKLNQNWNDMCAECHSTDVHKNYDPATNRFATMWSEISVGCEACHGAGSRHVAWAQARGKAEDRSWDSKMALVVRFDERLGVSWAEDPKTGLLQRSRPPALLRKEVETCGRCHARRSELSEKWTPGQWLSDAHEVSLFNRATIYADGQMRDNEEIYNYAPFKQSKMFAKGVTCSDCHDPHSARLRVSGAGVCLQCHTSDKYRTTAHSHHGAKSKVTCISCHMPVRSYMVVDRRHDHSFRVPRPDLSVKLGTPNACNDCHHDRSPQWAAAAVERWFGPHREGFQHYAAAFHAAWTDQPKAGKLLVEVASESATPAFVRASAFDQLNAYVAQIDVKLARKGLSDPDPIVRVGALDMLAGIPADRIWQLVSPLLADPIRGVRIKAAFILAGISTANLPQAERERFERAAAEFVTAQRLNADRPQARTELGTFYAQRGLVTQAEREFRAALRLSPEFAPAAINLADLYRALGRDHEGIDVLRKALVASPKSPGLHYALGLGLVRAKETSEALTELQRATELAPKSARYAYVYAVGLNSVGRSRDAISVLKQNLARHPSDRNTLVALILFNRDTGDIGPALEYADRFEKEFPADKEMQRIIRDLKMRTK